MQSGMSSSTAQIGNTLRNQADHSPSQPKAAKPSGRFRNQAIALTFLVLFALLVASCASEAPEPTPSPTIEARDPTATQTVASTPTLTPTQGPPTPTPTPELGIGSTRISEADQMVQVYVPAGEFTMGADDSEAKRSLAGGVAYPENPVHTVYLDAYWIDKYEVSNAQFAECVNAGVCIRPFVPYIQNVPDYYYDPTYANYPVVWISWATARTYCDWVGRRLPTEAEWEKAARGTDARLYPWGNDPITGDRVNFCDRNCPRPHAVWNIDDGYAQTAPVDAFPAGASPYGALNMSGNVWEWNSTLISFYPYDANDGREDPDAAGNRVWRGGPWSNGGWWMRSSIRYHSVPHYVNDFLGFRCASSE
jgi:serine/threonine-protein kinase